MASYREVVDVIDTLMQGQLSYAPKTENLVKLVPVWTKVLARVPGPALEQAAIDWITEQKDFPKPAQLIDLAQKVVANNGQSVAGGWFAAPRTYEKLDPNEIKGIAQVTAGGWLSFNEGDLKGKRRIDWPALAAEWEEAERVLAARTYPTFTSWEEAQAWREAQENVQDPGLP